MLPIILLVIGTIGLIAFLLWRRSQDPIQKQFSALKMTETTPLGVKVNSERGFALLEAIDDEFRAVQALIAPRGWSINPSEYTVHVFPSARDYDANNVYSPCFKLHIGAGSWYDESDYDQEKGKAGGWIYAAEWVVDLQAKRFVITQNHSEEYTRACIHNGLDHIILFHNDIDWYGRTADHSNGGGHPILQ